jgi:hypothetical protein
MTDVEQSDYALELMHNIETYGFQVTSVFDPKGKDPNFAYSIGIQKTTGSPEMIVFGMSPRTAHYLISTYFEQAKAGRCFVPSRPYSGFSKNHTVFVQPVLRSKYAHFMAAADGYYGKRGYKAVQLIYPDKLGRWPWNADVPSRFKSLQPVLGPVPLGQSRTAVRRKQVLLRSRLNLAQIQAGG